MEAVGRAKKIMSISLTIFAWFMIVLTVFIMVFTIVSVNTFDRSDRNLFGIKFYIVESDSMSLSDQNAGDAVHFNAGDIVLVKMINDEEKSNLKAGDIISFISLNDDDSYGKVITHMIKDKKFNRDGEFVGYVTYGTNTGTVDAVTVTPGTIEGVYVGQIASLGYFFEFFRTIPGYIVCILIPFLILIVYMGIKCFLLFRKHKKEQTAELEAEKAKLEEERRKSLEMEKELEALKAQLAERESTEAEATQEDIQDSDHSQESVEPEQSDDISDDIKEN